MFSVNGELSRTIDFSKAFGFDFSSPICNAEIVREKGFALPLVLAAVSLGIIVFGVIGYSQLKSKFLQQPQTTSEKSNDETGWRVYNNSDFKFQISYPEMWSLEEDE